MDKEPGLDTADGSEPTLDPEAAEPRPAPSVFLSYSRKDQPAARKIIAALRASGIEVWWDELLPTGSTFSSTIEQAIARADAVAVLWSANSVGSHWVRDEAQIGCDRGNLLPLTMDGSMPPLGFGQFHVTDLSHWNGRPGHADFAPVLRAIHERAGGPMAPPSLPPAPGGRMLDRRRVLIAGGTIALVTAVGGAAAWRYLDGNGRSGSAAVRRLAVLPFANLSGDASQSYFSDGLADDLRSALAQNPQIQVAAQSSSNMFRGNQDGATSIAGKLGVDHLVSGSVRRADGQVRIVVQLIDGSNGFMNWSQTFDRPMGQIFALQDEIVSTVSRTLSFELLGPGDKAGARRGGTDNVGAYDAYLQGAQLYNLSTGEQTDRAALAAFDRAIALDGNYAAAWAGKARVLTALANGATSDREVGALRAQSTAAAQRAVASAPDYADGHAALGYALLNGRVDMAAAAGPYRRSVELGGNDADILVGYASFATRLGDLAGARDAIAKAVRLDPLNAMAMRVYGNLEFTQRAYDKAIDRYRQALALNPAIHGAHAAIGDAQVMLGALDAADQAYRAEPSRLYAQRGLAILAARRRDKAGSAALLADFTREFGVNALYQQAEVLAQQGAIALALDRLDQARAARDSGLILARGDPFLDPLRASPRFTALLAAIGFPQQ